MVPEAVLKSLTTGCEKMKIVHISPVSPYNEGWGYQENLLPKYHKKLGNDVTLIITDKMHKDGKIVSTEENDKIMNDGVRLIRRKQKEYPFQILTSAFSKMKVYDLLEEIKPDYIFFHGLASITFFDVIKYKKKINPQVRIVQDSHADYNNGVKAKGIKRQIVKIYYAMLNKITQKHVERVFGVTPWRKTYAREMYKISPEKLDVLIMGADDEKIDFLHHDEIKKSIREKYGIQNNEFLVVSGGKIEKSKNILKLMQAVNETDKNIKLLLFGSVKEEIEQEFESLLSEKIIYVGWIDGSECYNYFFAGDLVAFPGQHSVLWEQAVATKVPCVFMNCEGMQHVNNGGNSDFFESTETDAIKRKIEELCFTEKYEKMKKVAMSDKTDIYLYSKIAEKSLRAVQNENS